MRRQTVVAAWRLAASRQTHPGAGSLIGGCAECYWVVRKSVISGQHLQRWWWLVSHKLHTCTHTLALAHTRRQIEGRQGWEQNDQHGNSCIEMWQIRWKSSCKKKRMTHVKWEEGLTSSNKLKSDLWPFLYALEYTIYYVAEPVSTT